MTVREFSTFKPSLGKNVFIDETAVVIGQVSLGDDCSVWPNAVIRGDINTITVGHRTNIQDGTIIHVDHDSKFHPGGSQVVIGNDVTIGHQVLLHGCKIEDCCLIGMGSLILDEAILEKYVLLGAGSLVPGGKILDGGYLWLGRPAKKIRPLTEEELEFFEYSAKHYATLKEKHR